VPDDPAPDSLSPVLETILGRFSRLVRQVAARHGVRQPELDELFQDVRIRLWSALRSDERIKGVSSSYVYQTARAACLDRLRQARSRREVAVHLEDRSTERSLSTAPAAEAALEREELAGQLARAVGALSESRRPVVRMYLAGYDREEIAEVLGWSEARTRNLLYRGLHDLRTSLAAQGIGRETAR
jgi:RNA polymerase sigma-70 factor (ECF subfamily)